MAMESIPDGLFGDMTGLPPQPELPEPTMGNLKEIEELLNHYSRSVIYKEPLIKQIGEKKYLPRLLTLFQTCEDLESLEELYTLGSIMRSIIMLNDTSIFEFILRDDAFHTIVGILECTLSFSLEWL